MLVRIIALTLLIAAVIFIRGVFKKKVSARLVYALWFTVIIRLCIPFNLISVELPFPDVAEIYGMFADSGDTVTNEELSLLPAPDTATTPPLSSPSEIPSSPSAVPEKPAVDMEIKTENTAPESIEESKKAYDPEGILTFIWICGSCIVLLAFAIPYAFTTAKLYKSRKYYKSDGKIKIYISDRIESPCVMGIIPSIYLTQSAADCPDLSLIISHENTHIRHGDHVWAYVRVLLIIALWWNPFIWIAAFLSKTDAELACDESVVKSMDERRRLEYSRLIVDMIPKRGGFAVAFANKPIKYRILRLTGKFKTTVIAVVITSVTVCLACLFAFVSNGVNSGPDAVFHIHTFSTRATCTAAAACDCGETRGKPLGHKWMKATCSSPKTCRRCDLTEGIPLEHTWIDATCDTAKTCSACKITEGKHLEHIFVDATCTAPNYCSLCNKPKGKALGHDLIDATCTSPVTCSRCTYTEGEALSHIWTNATCTTPKTCTVCSTTEGTPIGHRFQFESCAVCQLPNKEFLSKLSDSEGILNYSLSKYGISKTGFSLYLSSFGYTNAEIEYIIEKLDPNWYVHAEKAAAQCRKSYGIYTCEGIYYTKKLVIINLLERGFTMEEAEHGYKYISEISPSAGNTYYLHRDPFIYIYNWYK